MTAQHVDAVVDVVAEGGGLPQQGRLVGLHDDVAHHRCGREGFGREWQGVAGSQSERGRVDREVAVMQGQFGER